MCYAILQCIVMHSECDTGLPGSLTVKIMIHSENIFSNLLVRVQRVIKVSYLYHKSCNILGI